MHATNREPIRTGIFLIVAAALAISLQDVVFKLFSSQLTLWQIFALRGLFAVPALLAIGLAQPRPRDLIGAAFGRWPLLRALFITTTFLAFYAALPFLNLSTVGAANYIAPIFVALLSAYVIGERVGPAGWLGVVLGFAGVLVLLKPGTDAFSPWALLPVLGAAFYALAHITTRVRCRGVSVAALSLAQNLVMTLAGVLVSLVLAWIRPEGAMANAYPYIFGTWAALALADWLVLALLAGFAVGIGMLLAGAYKIAPPAVVSTCEYSYLVFVALWDTLVFGVAPTVSSAAGMSLIVIAGLLVLRR